MHEFEDERPIQLGRAAGAAVTPDPDGSRGALTDGCQEAREFLVCTGSHQNASGALAHDCPEAREFLVATGIHQNANRGTLPRGRPGPAEPPPAWPLPDLAAHDVADTGDAPPPGQLSIPIGEDDLAIPPVHGGTSA